MMRRKISAAERKSRDDALAAGKLKYMSASPCKRGHIGERYVSNRCCCSCNAGKRTRTIEAYLAKPQPERKPRLYPRLVAGLTIERLMAGR